MKKNYIVLMGILILFPLTFQYAMSVSFKTKTVVNVNKDLIIKEVTATYYNAESSQCDGDPLITADNSRIDLKKLKNQEIRWIALSRDLIKRWNGPFNYGDTLYIHHPNEQLRGLWIVKDCMNARFTNRIDFLIDTTRKDFPGYSENVLISNVNFLEQ